MWGAMVVIGRRAPLGVIQKMGRICAWTPVVQYHHHHHHHHQSKVSCAIGLPTCAAEKITHSFADMCES